MANLKCETPQCNHRARYIVSTFDMLARIESSVRLNACAPHLAFTIDCSRKSFSNDDGLACIMTEVTPIEEGDRD